jgi:hypothetical protein
MGVNAPLLVARASCFTVPAHYDAAQMVIHAAQVSLANASAAIFPGADTDTLRAEWRVGGCHFSTEGLVRHADLWFEILTRVHYHSLISRQ